MGVIAIRTLPNIVCVSAQRRQLVDCNVIFVERRKIPRSCCGGQRSGQNGAESQQSCKLVGHAEWRSPVDGLLLERTIGQSVSTPQVAASCRDCGTFRVPPLMSKRTIRIPYEGWWRGRRDLHLRRCDRVAVEQKFYTDCSGENSVFTSRIIVLIRSVISIQLCCCLIPTSSTY